MDPLDENALRILPIYEEYEKLYEPRLPWMVKTGAFIGLSIFALAFVHLASGTRPLFWEGMVMAYSLLVAVSLFIIWGAIGIFRPKAKSLEMEFRERSNLDQEYGRRLAGFPSKSRVLFLKDIRHHWEIVEVRNKTWAAICLTLGGIISALPEWTGKPKSTYSFLVVVIALSYVWFLVNQTSLAKAKRFGELLERE